MATFHFTARVKEGLLLELPEEAQELGLNPGDEVKVSVEKQIAEERPAGEHPAFPPNDGMLAVLRKIEESKKDRPYTDGSNTLKLIREARNGAMYDLDPTDDLDLT